ncbi:MAG: bifunctional diaminohydroxyphosphoribosylaminopyrimidine deaminase/5-amino-6-(5-phosphoribosylamino)uracil reductase RibD [Bdellovibrionales bacterium]|nr:bifunctional diaminohydroxyphosphoribosylaminopyrimidine deaminase/5-amino-6-(5-phosphoribosylamino)uracil reductase RibD [Bdellovibrionales bacterium]
MNKEQAMSLAIEQARRGLGRVSPNPPVGAVILNSRGQLISTGYHQALGADHAEIMALKNNKHSLEQAVLYVTLEPCAHQGLTPSCVDQLIKLPFSKVCIGLKDPNPKVCGRGIRKLTEADIEVEMYEGPLTDQLEELIEIFSYNMKEQKPFVALKVASSLDGHIAVCDRKWITNEFSREHVSLLRGHYDAVCIGVQTFLTDNPRLNSRHPHLLDQDNTVILLDPEGLSFSSLKDSRLLQVRDTSKVIIVTQQPPASLPVPCGVIQQKENPFNLDQLCEQLFQKGVRSILVEGGGEVFSSFLEKSQRIYLFLSPFLAGDKGRKRWWSEEMDFPVHLSSVCTSSFQEDLLITGLLAKKEP